MANTTKSAGNTGSTTTKKPAAKKAAPAKKTDTVKKTQAKAAAEKKGAPAKKPAVKKETPAKKTQTKAVAKKKSAPIKKPVVKKETPIKKIQTKAAAEKKTTPAKKPAVKKETPAKKTAVKITAEKKNAPVKKPAIKAVPAKKTAAVKEPSAGTTVKKTAVPKSPAAPKQAALAKTAPLFEVYAQDPVKMIKERGYIVSASFSANPAYAIYEIVSFFDVKKIYSTAVGLTFVCRGRKLYILIEPASYTDKQTEPANRKEGEKIEKHFSDLEIITAGNQAKIMIAKEPSETFGTFTVVKPSGKNFALALKKLPDVYASLEELIEKSFAEGVPHTDAKAAAALTIKTVEKAMPV